MLKKLFNIIRLCFLRINIYIFPDIRNSLKESQTESAVSGFLPEESGASFIKGTDLSDVNEKFRLKKVLVGVFRNIFQFEICLGKRFYYIPYDMVEGFENSLEYIALYQSKNLFGYDAGIRYYGKISSCEIVTRDKITEIPNENDGIYCRFEVDEWMNLENVIYPKEIGFIREFTTLYLLKNSREVPQLFSESLDEFNLYNAVALAVEQRQKVKFKNLSMFTRKGYLLVFDGKKLTHFYPEKEFRIRPGATVKNMMKDLGL